MKITATILVLSCTIHSMAQGPSTTQERDLAARIGAFVTKVEEAVQPTTPALETERSCAQYAWIRTEALALAGEVRAERDRSPDPATEYAMINVIAAGLQDSQPDAAAYLSAIGTYRYVTVMQAYATRLPVYRLEDIGYFAEQAEKAKTTKRMMRMHDRMLRRIDELGPTAGL